MEPKPPLVQENRLDSCGSEAPASLRAASGSAVGGHKLLGYLLVVLIEETRLPDFCRSYEF